MSRPPERLIRTALGAAREALRLEDLDDVVLPSLARAVGASQTLLFRHESTRLTPHAGTLVTEMPYYGDHLVNDDPIHERLGVVRPRPVITDDVIPYGALWSSGAYNDFYAPRDMRFLTALWLTDQPYGSPG